MCSALTAPLALECYKQNLTGVQALLSAGADVNQCIVSWSQSMLVHTNPSTVRLFTKHCSTSVTVHRELVPVYACAHEPVYSAPFCKALQYD